MGVSGVPDIRESGPIGYPGYLRDIRDIRNQGQGWGYQVPSLISLIQHRLGWLGPESESRRAGLLAYYSIMMSEAPPADGGPGPCR